MITGPGSPSVLSNMIVSIEQHVDWIADCIAYLRERGIDDASRPTARRRGRVGRARQRGRRCDALSRSPTPGTSGANIPGKPRVFMPYVGGVGAYRKKCDEIAAEGYDGFMLAAERVSAG